MRGTRRVKTLYVKDQRLVDGCFPCFHVTGSVQGMREQFYGKDALLVRCGSWIYNVSRRPEIYYYNSH